MPVEERTVTREQLTERRAELLARVGLTWDELTERKLSGLLVGDEWQIWDELDGITFLLDG